MKEETILCISNRNWDTMWRNDQQIMSRIAEQNRVFYFQSGRKPGQGVASQIIRSLSHPIKLRTQQLHNNLILVPSPPYIPYLRQLLPRSVLQIITPLVAKVNTFMLSRQILRMKAKFKITNPILWLYDPYYFHLVGKFGEKLSCYYNYDEFAEFSTNVRIRDVVRQADDCLSRRVNVVFASSGAQCRRRKKLNPSTYFIPNGVDFELFNRALTSDLPVPADMDRIPRPIIGFAGWLGWHIDVCLLLRIANAYPGFSFVLVGPDELLNSRDAKRLRSHSNVFFLGQKDRTELPSYLRTFDVALMPFQMTVYKKSSYPLKLHEYLAAGRSVVATALPELEPFNKLIRMAQTHEEFIGFIPEALDDNGRAATQARVETARENTWNHRVAQIYNILNHHLSNSSA